MEPLPQHIKEWIAARKNAIAVFIALFFVSSLSFGIGYLMAKETNRAPIVIEKCSEL